MNVRDIFGVAILVAFLHVAGNLAGDPGVGWHLRSGEWILAHHQVPRSDMLLAGSPARGWVHDQWLSDVLFWCLFQLAGLGLLQTFLLGMLSYSFVGILGGLVARESRFAILTLAVLSILAPLITLQWFIRPLAFSFLLFTLLYVLLQGELGLVPNETKKKSSVLAFLVPGIFLLWANLHGGFLTGFLLLVAACAASLLRRETSQMLRYLSLLVFGILAACFTPYGISLYSSIGSLLGNSFFMQLNTEWQSPNFADALFFPFLLILLFFGAAQLRGLRFGSDFDLVLLLGFAALGLFERRAIPYFGIVAALPLLRIFQQWLENRKGRSVFLRIVKILPERSSGSFLPASCLVFCLSLARVPFVPREDLPPLPKGLLSFSESVHGGRVFHSPDLGGLLSWYQPAGLKPSIDDRNQVCSQADYEEYFDIVLARKDWQEKLKRYSGIILQKSDPLRILLPSTEWTKVGEDESTLYYLRVS